MKTIRAGFITKIVLLALIVYLSITLLNLRGKIQSANAALLDVQAQTVAQAADNAALQEDIEHGSDPDTVLQIAKEKLGLVEQGEVVFFDTTN